MNPTALREVSNLSTGSGDVKQRLAQRRSANLESCRYPYSSSAVRHGSGSLLSLRSSLYSPVGTAGKESSVSPHADRLRENNPVYCSDVIKDITTMYMESEKEAIYGQVLPSPRYLTYQPEINEKMRMILVDWLIDVHLKFKLHPETLYLTVSIVDRYLSSVNTRRTTGRYIPRSKLQLVGITAILLAAKYEEIWPPEVKECVYICANTYTRDEVIRMEREMCTELSFRFTVPTPFPFIVRLLDVVEGLERQQQTQQLSHQLQQIQSQSQSQSQQTQMQASQSQPQSLSRSRSQSRSQPRSDEECTAYVVQLRHTAFFFLDHGMLDYKCLQFSPSQQAKAALFLALVTLHMKEQGSSYVLNNDIIWTRQLQYYSKAQVRDFKACARTMLDFVSYVSTTRYQSVRRKYSSSKYGEVAKLTMPSEVPDF
uniref:Cyclin 6 n=1 Tax=Trypanosoma brucei TaxID=5691 RepID=Q8IEW8_9TRYP|nr:cyclin 6 [Trypanosoma brucei]